MEEAGKLDDLMAQRKTQGRKSNKRLKARGKGKWQRNVVLGWGNGWTRQGKKRMTMRQRKDSPGAVRYGTPPPMAEGRG
jgi:hypothetical protein